MQTVIQAAYWPIVAVLLLLGLVTFYHLAPPHRLPWRRGFPGALLAAMVFLGGTSRSATYIDFVVDHGLTYGALAAPIGALLFFYVLALAVLLGAELNATIEQTWPARKRAAARRRRRRTSGGGARRSGSSPSSPGGRFSKISLHSGHTGYFFGSRDGVQTLPHSARTGVPLTSASISLSLRHVVREPLGVAGLGPEVAVRAGVGALLDGRAGTGGLRRGHPSMVPPRTRLAPGARLRPGR